MGLNEKVRKLEERFDAVEVGFENLVKAFNERRKVILSGFEHYDQHMWVLHLMVQDAGHGRLRLWPPDDSAVIEAKRLKEQEIATGEKYTEKALDDLLARTLTASPDAMIDMEWYLQRYKYIRSALSLFGYLHHVVKDQENGTSS